MSGHSKWATIKRKKGAKDAARGKLFSQLAKEIRLAVQAGGADISFNFGLRLAIDRAKAANMPKDNIDRNISKASGADGTSLTTITYEIYGPAGSMIVVDCETDNTNRTLNDVKGAVMETGSKLANPGSVSWQFESIGLITLEPKKLAEEQKFGGETIYDNVDPESMQMEFMEIDGVTDVDFEDDQITIYADKDSWHQVRDYIIGKGYKLSEAKLIRNCDNQIELTGEDYDKFQKLIDMLDDADDVVDVWSNVSN